MAIKRAYVPNYDQVGQTDNILSNQTEYGFYTYLKNTFRYLFIKRFFDIVCSFALLICLLPFILLISILIKITSEGPAIYKQKRIGKSGRLFTLYKFRSMVNGADNLKEHLPTELIEFYQVNRKIVNDPRITRVGKVLRRTSLDELPQLINILKGDMSFVGPRPMLPDEIEMYGENFKRYITVTPGLTGLWQILNRTKTTMRDRETLDMVYLNHIGFVIDFMIVIKTVLVIFTAKGAC